jgi:peptidoglycan/LPS O-acetylase OafA/YrhL
MVIADHHPYFGFMSRGWVGVDLFFVLSGFLISGLLFREIKETSNIKIGRFLLRRGFKIYPAFYFFVAVTALLFPALRRYLGIEVAFLQSYYAPSIAGWGHLWSLAVEEHFYFALPLLLLCLNRRSWLRFVPTIAIGLIIICFLLRWEYCSRTHLATVLQSHLRMDALFAGVALGYLFHFHPELFQRLSKPWLPILAAAFLIPLCFPQTSALKVTATYSANTLAFGSLLLWAVTRKFKLAGVLAEIGQYSYSIYLWQMILAYLWPQTALGFFGYLVSSIAVGTAMSIIIEYPMIKLRDRLFQKKREAAPLLLSHPIAADSPGYSA